VRNKEQIKKSMREFYETSAGYLTHLKSKNDQSFQDYVSFVQKYAKTGAKILDLGCGNGLSSYLLNKKGFDATWC